jgi:hypothetical protein
MSKISDDECVYNYIMGLAIAAIACDNYLDHYGFGPMNERKRVAVVIAGEKFIAPDSPWVKFIKNVKAKPPPPGLIVEAYVPGKRDNGNLTWNPEDRSKGDTHFYAVRKDGKIANGYSHQVFVDEVGVGLNLQEDQSHGFCQTFAIMYLLISQKSIRSVKVNEGNPTLKQLRQLTNKDLKLLLKTNGLKISGNKGALVKRLNNFYKSYWDIQCKTWHEEIWNKLEHGQYKDLWEHNGRLALQFLAEFTKYCDWNWKINGNEGALKEMEGIPVRGCHFNRKATSRILRSIGDKDVVSLSGLFRYLNENANNMNDKPETYFSGWINH